MIAQSTYKMDRTVELTVKPEGRDALAIDTAVNTWFTNQGVLSYKFLSKKNLSKGRYIMKYSFKYNLNLN